MRLGVRNFRAVQWLGLSTFTARALIPFLVEELRSCKLCGTAIKNERFKPAGRKKAGCSDPLTRQCSQHEASVPVLLVNYGPFGASHEALVVKNLPAHAAHSGDSSLIPESGRSPGGGHGTPLQYSCPENPMDGGAWRAAVHGVAESWTGLEAECVGPHILFFFFFFFYHRL